MLTDTSVGELIENSLLVDYCGGGCTTVSHPYTTEWRVTPFAIYNQWVDSDMLLEIEGCTPQIIPCGEGSLVYEGVRHRLTTLTPGTRRVSWIHAQCTLLASVDIFRLLGISLRIPVATAERISQIAHALVALPHQTEDAEITVMVERKILGLQFLQFLLPLAETTSLEMLYLRQLQRLQPAIRYMQTHLHEKINRTQLADLIGISPQHFHGIFKQTMGKAPMEYLKSLRIGMAQQLLAETSLSIAAISTRVGIFDQFQFSRVFKQACGISPSLYRRTTLGYSNITARYGVHSPYHAGEQAGA